MWQGYREGQVRSKEGQESNDATGFPFWQAALVQAQIYAMNFIAQYQPFSVENKGCDFIDCT
ncbi:MAG: hypothetical protein D6778_00225 [Nitrospirae bacterium]|nr:MAG: hypothetical protein D6778_00225 [Nitrospirota bacterium]